MVLPPMKSSGSASDIWVLLFFIITKNLLEHVCCHVDVLTCGQLNIVEGKMQYLFDVNGKRYLDAFAGHCHPDVLEAIAEQNKLHQHATTINLHHTIGDFAEALASKMPGDLEVMDGLLAFVDQIYAITMDNRQDGMIEDIKYVLMLGINPIFRPHPFTC